MVPHICQVHKSTPENLWGRNAQKFDTSAPTTQNVWLAFEVPNSSQSFPRNPPLLPQTAVNVCCPPLSPLLLFQVLNCPMSLRRPSPKYCMPHNVPDVITKMMLPSISIHRILNVAQCKNDSSTTQYSSTTTAMKSTMHCRITFLLQPRSFATFPWNCSRSKRCSPLTWNMSDINHPSCTRREKLRGLHVTNARGAVCCSQESFLLFFVPDTTTSSEGTSP